MVGRRPSNSARGLDREIPPPAKTPEGRENQLITAAIDLVEQRIYSGEASAQETVHFLRLGSVRSKLEEEKLKSENDVLKTRIKEMESRISGEDLLSRALDAFRGYAGLDEPSDDPDLY